MLRQHGLYLLPDGTRVRYRQWDAGTNQGRLHRDDESSAPLYNVEADGTLQRYVYTPALDAYTPAPCDLTIADLRPLDAT